MREAMRYIAGCVLLGAVLTACGAASKEIAMKSHSERMDIFEEVAGDESIPAGYADVLITANIKTHLAGYYTCESKASARGKEAYPFLINIDGQAVLWKAKGERRELPLYLDGKTSRDPEAGEGMKYILDKKVRLAAGDHTVFFGLPEEPYSTIAKITVKSGGAYTLEFRPDYRYKTHPVRIPTFFRGIHRYDAVLTETRS